MNAHGWLYLPIVGNYQAVQCRWCGKVDGYYIVGYKPQPPDTPCAALSAANKTAERG